MIRIGLTFVLFSLASISLAGSFPKGCESVGFGFQNDFLVLNDIGKQAFYMVHNTSNRTIELQRYETQPAFMAPKLLAKISANRWAAFASDIQDFHFKCLYISDTNLEPVPCKDVVEICQYPRVKFALSNMGNYWVSVNRSLSKAKREAIAKGILLRW